MGIPFPKCPRHFQQCPLKTDDLNKLNFVLKLEISSPDFNS